MSTLTEKEFELLSKEARNQILEVASKAEDDELPLWLRHRVEAEAIKSIDPLLKGVGSYGEAVAKMIRFGGAEIALRSYAPRPKLVVVPQPTVRQEAQTMGRDLTVFFGTVVLTIGWITVIVGAMIKTVGLYVTCAGMWLRERGRSIRKGRQ